MNLVLTPTISVDLNPPKRTAKVKEILTGPQMILAMWIARVALEDQLTYDYIKKELDLKGDEAARLYAAIRNFLGDK